MQGEVLFKEAIPLLYFAGYIFQKFVKRLKKIVIYNLRD